MNQQVYSVFVSCLLASTFFHGLQASGVEVKKNRAYSGSGRYRRNAQTTLDLTYSAVNEILIVRNTTSNRAILIDTQQDVILLLDGGQNSGVVISQQENEGTLIPGGLWNANRQSLTGFLRSIGNNISSLLHRPRGTDFSIPRVRRNILRKITTIVVDLVVSLVPELEQRPELALELVLSIATTVETLLKGNTKGILVLAQNRQIPLSIDIAGVLNILQGVDTLNGYIGETAIDVIRRNRHINIGAILGARDGVVALTETLRQLGEIDDLSALNGPLGDPELLDKLIAQFGGNSNVGITGVFRVVGEIRAFANGRSNLDRVISILIQVVAESSEVVTEDLRGQLRNSLINLVEVLEENGNNEAVVRIIENVLRGQATVDGVNISNIISTILGGVIKPRDELLNVVITILQELSPIVDLSQSIPELLLVIIVQLDSATGIRNLISLGLDLGRPGCTCSLLEIALQSIQSVRNELFRDLYSALCDLPIIGNVIVSLQVALEAENIDLRQLLWNASQTRVLIIGLFQLVAEVDLGIAAAQLQQVEEVLRSTNGLATLVAVELTVTIVVIN